MSQRESRWSPMGTGGRAFDHLGFRALGYQRQHPELGKSLELGQLRTPAVVAEVAVEQTAQIVDFPAPAPEVTAVELQENVG